jgi:hypothetical protein
MDGHVCVTHRHQRRGSRLAVFDAFTPTHDAGRTLLGYGLSRDVGAAEGDPPSESQPIQQKP